MGRWKQFSPIIIVLTVLLVFRILTNDPVVNGGITYDTGNVTLGIIDYSLENDRPHLPGYYVHVLLAKGLLPLAQSPGRALLWLGWLYSFGAFLLLFALLKEYVKNRTYALSLFLIVLTNPLVWFYTSVSEMYSFDLLYPLLLLYIYKKKWGMWVIPAVMGGGTGIRPSSTVLLAGLYLWIYFEAFRNKRVSITSFVWSHMLGVLTLLLWLYPMVQSCGGVEAYLNLYETNNPVEKISLLQNLFRFSNFAVYFLPLYLVSLVLLVKRGVKVLKSETSFGTYLFLTLSWIIPPLLFFLLVHYSKGYFMLIAVPLILFPVAITKMSKSVMGGLTLFQVALFLFLPYKVPEVENSIKKEQRNASLLKTWGDRSLSLYLMGNNRIVGEAALQAELIKLVGSEDRTVYVGPTIHIPTRLLQVRLPNCTFWEMDKHTDGRYVCYKGLEIRDSLQMDLLDVPTSLFLTRNEFTDKYIPKSFGVIDAQSKNYSLIMYSTKEKETLDSIYTTLFQR